MRRVFLFLQLLFSVARKALSTSHHGAGLRLIRIIAALKRFVRGCFKSLAPGVSTSSPESRGTTPQQPIRSAQAPDRCMPSFLPTALHGQQQGALLPQDSVVPDTTLWTSPKPFAPERLQRYDHRRPVYVIFQLR
jgi:hypothetical protein